MPGIVQMPCSAHPRYNPRKAPPANANRDCVFCWATYGRSRAILDGLRSQGRAKGGGRSAKQKGRDAVIVVADRIREAFALEADDVLVKATSQGGCDIHLSPAAARRFPFSPEVKCDERLNIWAALVQAAANATPDRPHVVFFKRAKTDLYAALTAKEFLKLCLQIHERMPSNS